MWTFRMVIGNIIVIIQKIISEFNNTKICYNWKIIRNCALQVYFYLYLIFDIEYDTVLYIYNMLILIFWSASVLTYLVQ
jgi:hypothetical protein